MGIALSPEGVAIAHVLQRPGQVPVLAGCEFREAAAAQQKQALVELVREFRLGQCR